jgi:signal transduction histidine kinase
METEVNSILVAAHELKAPLAIIRQLAFSLDGLDSTNESIRSEMINISDRAIKQINDLTKIGRLEDGLFEMEPVVVRAVCDDVVNELAYLFRENNKKLRIKYKNRARLVVANRDLLYSVIYNFLLNAIHYSDEEMCSELVVNEKRGKVMISVRDYGPALPKDVWKEMRRGFVEKPMSIAMRPGSSGLGLYIASKFSRYMHANVGAVRHRDGTTFYVEVPVSRQTSLFGA